MQTVYVVEVEYMTNYNETYWETESVWASQEAAQQYVTTLEHQWSVDHLRISAFHLRGQ